MSNSTSSGNISLITIILFFIIGASLAIWFFSSKEKPLSTNSKTSITQEMSEDTEIGNHHEPVVSELADLKIEEILEAPEQDIKPIQITNADTYRKPDSFQAETSVSVEDITDISDLPSDWQSKATDKDTDDINVDAILALKDRETRERNMHGIKQAFDLSMETLTLLTE